MNTQIYAGKNLGKVRCLRGVKQDVIAHQLNIPQTVYSRIERGLITMNKEQLKILGQILEVPSDFLLRDDDMVILKPDDFIISGELLGEFKDNYEGRISELKGQVGYLQSVIDRLIGGRNKRQG